MNNSAWRIMCVIGAVAMAAVSIICIVMGGCPGMLDLANGNSVPMKCHWAFIADTFIGIIGIVIALLAITCKDQSGRRAMAIGYIVTAAIAACMPMSFAIGICANAEMHCHSTALVVWALCVVAIVIGIVQVVKANPEVANLPKRSI